MHHECTILGQIHTLRINLDTLAPLHDRKDLHVRRTILRQVHQHRITIMQMRLPVTWLYWLGVFVSSIYHDEVVLLRIVTADPEKKFPPVTNPTLA